MDKQEIKSAIATLSDNGISPYDLLLALGNTDAVPNEVIKNRKKRIISRDGKESYEGFLKNALEDLKKMDFKGKEQVIKVLEGNISPSALSGLATFDLPPNEQALQLLHLGFVITPLLTGADKFFNWSTDWNKYLSPAVERISPLPKQNLLQLVGGLEMIVGIITALNPEIGGYIYSVWMGMLSINLLGVEGHRDVALRNITLGLASLAMARLAKN